jgi:hypothetical protein
MTWQLIRSKSCALVSLVRVVAGVGPEGELQEVVGFAAMALRDSATFLSD